MYEIPYHILDSVLSSVSGFHWECWNTTLTDKEGHCTVFLKAGPFLVLFFYTLVFMFTKNNII
jgi:hypothetical protein